MLSIPLVAFVASLLSPWGHALPTSDGGSSCRTVDVVSNFDNITAVPGTTLNQIPVPYNGLFYQAFTVLSVVQTNLAPGVLPHSPTQYAGTESVGETVNGTPMLTTNFPNSRSVSYDLESFYFGCGLDLFNAAAAAPTQCLISITGYKGSDNTVASSQQVCSQQFEYNPSTNLGPQEMAFSGQVLSCFKGIQFAVVQFDLPGGMSALDPDLALVIDNMAYKLTTC